MIHQVSHLIFVLPVLGIMGWDDILMLAVKALMSAGAAKAVGSATAGKAIVPPGDVPPMQQMDFSKLLNQAQQQSNLPQIQRQIPPPNYY